MSKEYIVTYNSEEHFEVIGWVSADSMEEAKGVAKEELAKEAEYYGASEAEIAEFGPAEKIFF